MRISVSVSAFLSSKRSRLSVSCQPGTVLANRTHGKRHVRDEQLNFSIENANRNELQHLICTGLPGVWRVRRRNQERRDPLAFVCRYRSRIEGTALRSRDESELNRFEADLARVDCSGSLCKLYIIQNVFGKGARDKRTVMLLVVTPSGRR